MSTQSMAVGDVTREMLPHLPKQQMQVLSALSHTLRSLATRCSLPHVKRMDGPLEGAHKAMEICSTHIAISVENWSRKAR